MHFWQGDPSAAIKTQMCEDTPQLRKSPNCGFLEAAEVRKWEKYSFELALFTFPLTLCCKKQDPELDLTLAVFLGATASLGKSLEQTRFQRELETRLVWMMTKSTNKTRGVLCEINPMCHFHLKGI